MFRYGTATESRVAPRRQDNMLLKTLLEEIS
jgi:hypothetical protein